MDTQQNSNAWRKIRPVGLVKTLPTPDGVDWKISTPTVKANFYWSAPSYVGLELTLAQVIEIEVWARSNGNPYIVLGGSLLKKDGTVSRVRRSVEVLIDEPQPAWLADIVDNILPRLFDEVA